LHHQILPIPRKPYALNWLPERLIVSHYEKDYGAAVRSLNALRDRLAALDLSSVTAAEMRALKREELSAVGSVILHEPLLHDSRRRRQGPGCRWVVLTYSPYEGRLYNQIAIDQRLQKSDRGRAGAPAPWGRHDALVPGIAGESDVRVLNLFAASYSNYVSNVCFAVVARIRLPQPIARRRVTRDGPD